MALKYYVLNRADLSKGAGTEDQLFYGQICINGHISYEEICDNVCLMTSATQADVAGVLDGLMLLMRQHLAKGNIVELGDVGKFRLSVGSSGVKDPDNFTVHLFKRPRIVFSPGKALKELCTKVRYERMKCDLKRKECTKEHIE
ncbi:MAG: HU family DNA-binding protein [Tannerellaceae bacterium]|nr:HU family DNA-binding protein [Tannerellaceae bacterium]